MRFHPSLAAAAGALILAALAPVPASSAAEPATPVTSLTCDPSGDGSWNDCIRHRHVHGTRDHILEGDDPLTIRTRVHPALHGADLIGETQVRPLDLAGKPTGTWTTVSAYGWSTDPGGANHAKLTHACTPPTPGLYQVRTRVEIPKSHHGAVTADGTRAGGVYATSESTTVASNGANCFNSDTDENIIEYFNLINYMGDFMISITSKSDDAYDVGILCPERLESADMPPSEFALTLATATGGLQTECYSPTPLTISKGNPDCDSTGLCAFTITASNSATDKIYSETELTVLLRNDDTENPELNPASLPICLTTVTPCLTDDTCSLTPSSRPTLELVNPGDGFDADDPVAFTSTVVDQ